MKNSTLIYALITRATGKIGESFARILAREGYSLVLVDTKPDLLEKACNTIQEEFPSTHTVCINKDLTPESASYELYREVKEQNLTIELLINNEEIEHLDQNPSLKHTSSFYGKDGIPTTNAFLKHPLTILFLKEMMAQNTGKIMHFISTINRARNIRFSTHNFDKPLIFSLIEVFQNTIQESLIELNILNSQKYSLSYTSLDDLDLRHN
ncbi:SDR family NAD(P)-dependent oxidoreductase [Runella sp. CRIBMP]|uniref:SDR family NAD(P)-dependent oxidoreductase n=1 Tax=Runella sp. CRIBMP TaxID=2683261 RepID=UPI00141264D9|nr:SDR family NAD(P)-dependent oxidoreductase [Runella sp. CRIBMP]NBB23154.1 SDR family NAD(P)-dependent oxidoreductase [Runella sp. CRIBMP]